MRTAAALLLFLLCFIEGKDKASLTREETEDATSTTVAAPAAAARASSRKDTKDTAAEADRHVVNKTELRPQPQKDAMKTKLGIGLGVSLGLLALIAIGVILFFVIRRRKANKGDQQQTTAGEKQDAKCEYKMANGLTVIVRNGQKKTVIKGTDFHDMGPLVRNGTNFDVNKDYGLENQGNGADKQVDEYFFDKDHNQAYQIGEGVEVVGKEDSASMKVGEIKGDGLIEDADVELVANGNVNNSMKSMKMKKSIRSVKAKKAPAVKSPTPSPAPAPTPVLSPAPVPAPVQTPAHSGSNESAMKSTSDTKETSKTK